MTGSVLADTGLGLLAVFSVFGWIMRQLKTSADDKASRANRCAHESDGLCYTSDPPQMKCRKCGAHYAY